MKVEKIRKSSIFANGNIETKDKKAEYVQQWIWAILLDSGAAKSGCTIRKLRDRKTVVLYLINISNDCVTTKLE